MSAKTAAWQPVSAHGLYDRDFQAWAFEQARLLREGRFDQIDAQHLAEEIEDIGKAEARALKSELTQLLAHLLKLAYSPATDPRGHWEQEVILQRLNIEALLSDNPGLTPRMGELHASAWNGARKLALAALRQDGVRDVPEANPFTLDQVRDPDYLPGQSG